MRKRSATATTAQAPVTGAAESLVNSRPSSPGSAPSTLAESLRSYWESRRGPRRTTAPLLRSLHRIGTRAPHTSSKRGFVRTSAVVNASVARLVKLVVRDFVHDWYQRVTDDKEFAAQVTGQLSQMVSEIEKRCLRVDWLRFVLFELPEIVQLHVRDAQQCAARLGTAYVGRETSIEAVFQSMQPHVALTLAADSELVYLRRLSHELLRVFMPAEAQGDEVVHHLLREILACAVLRNAVDALSDPSTLNEGIIQAVGKYSKKDYFAKADISRYVTKPMCIDDEDGGEDGARGGDGAAGATSDHAAAAVTVETMLREAQTTQISGQKGGKPATRAPDAACDAAARDEKTAQGRQPSNAQQPYRSAESDGGDDGGGATDPGGAAQGVGAIAGIVAERLSGQLSFASRWLISDLFSQARWRGWRNYTLRGLIYLHLIVTQAFSRIFTVFSEYTFSLNQLWQSDSGHEAGYRGAIGCVFGLLNAVLLLDRYNQWAWVQFMFYIFPLVNALAGAAIDRTLVKVVRFLVSEHQIAMYLDALVSNLWKAENGGKFRTGNRPYRTLEQQRMLKEDAEELVAELLPYVATRFFYGLTEQERMVAARRILEPFENRQLNKHLVYIVLDSIVGKIAPELQEARDQPAPPTQQQQQQQFQQ
ncbi:hypothetical protein LPJ61_004180 [Coemansia biformis]|uniref:PXA domain-containing protein n=1 Tax=Coemansia biformis TaxID=1286918 RepID=A0A9W7Y5A7_9FUNG|nr:hypothetical protein LPJ61_004180 [Coemansia biformis]